jgi:hypothetical protein
MAEPHRPVNPKPPIAQLDQTMAGILAMLIAEREDRLNEPAAPRKTEIILRGAGLDIATIASVTGKNYKAIQMSIARSKRKKTSRKSLGRRGRT